MMIAPGTRGLLGQRTRVLPATRRVLPETRTVVRARSDIRWMTVVCLRMAGGIVALSVELLVDSVAGD